MGWDLQREDATISNATAVVAVVVVVVVDDAVRWLPMRCGALQVASHRHGVARHTAQRKREEGDTGAVRGGRKEIRIQLVDGWDGDTE